MDIVTTLLLDDLMKPYCLPLEFNTNNGGQNTKTTGLGFKLIMPQTKVEISLVDFSWTFIYDKNVLQKFKIRNVKGIQISIF